jgi:hypothetical protein
VPDPINPDELNAVSFRAAMSLTRRMLEKRFVSATDAPGLLRFFGKKAAEISRSREPLGYPAMRHAADLTGCLIERGRISGKDAVADSLSTHVRALDAVAVTLPPDRVRAVMAASTELVVKMFETVTLSAGAVPGTLLSIAAACLETLEGRTD